MLPPMAATYLQANITHKYLIMKYRLLLALIFCYLNLFIAQVSAESVYKWVDAQGNVHYGDHPQGAAQPLHVTPPPPVDAASQQRLEALKKQGKDNERKKEAAAKTMENPGSNQAVAKRNCAIAKANLTQLEGNTDFLIDKDAEGNNRLMPPEERSKNTETVRRDVEFWCKWV